MDTKLSYEKTGNLIRFEQVVEQLGDRKKAHDVFRCEAAVVLADFNHACRDVQVSGPLQLLENGHCRFLFQMHE